MEKGAIAVILVISLGWLTGCGSPTPYQPALDGLGYAEQPLEENRYRVTFAGNRLTPRETVENYLLYRAAEVTLAQGYDHFIMVTQDTERKTTYHTTITGIGGHSGFHHYDHPPSVGGFASGTAWPQDRYASFANIIIRRGGKPADNPHAYDAREVLMRLGPTIARPVVE